MSVTKDSSVAVMADVKYKVAFRRAQWAFSVDQCISSLFFYDCTSSMIFIINTLITCTKILLSKRQVPKPIKLLEGIGNGGNGALIRSTVIL